MGGPLTSVVQELINESQLTCCHSSQHFITAAGRNSNFAQKGSANKLFSRKITWTGKPSSSSSYTTSSPTILIVFQSSCCFSSSAAVFSDETMDLMGCFSLCLAALTAVWLFAIAWRRCSTFLRVALRTIRRDLMSVV